MQTKLTAFGAFIWTTFLTKICLLTFYSDQAVTQLAIFFLIWQILSVASCLKVATRQNSSSIWSRSTSTPAGHVKWWSLERVSCFLDFASQLQYPHFPEYLLHHDPMGCPWVSLEKVIQFSTGIWCWSQKKARDSTCQVLSLENNCAFNGTDWTFVALTWAFMAWAGKVLISQETKVANKFCRI